MARKHLKRPRKRRNWIKGALKKRRQGALRKSLGIRGENVIPLGLLKKAAKKGGKLGRRARFALAMHTVAERRKRK